MLHRLIPAFLIAAVFGASLPSTAQTASDIKGQAIFAERCSTCHDKPGGRAPPTFFLKRRLPSEIVYALTKGAMRTQSAGLSEDEIELVARSLTGREIDAMPAADANLCKTPGTIAIGSKEWASWGQNIHNTRFLPDPGLTATDLPKLKVKWAFALPGLAGAPTVAGDYLFVTSLLVRFSRSMRKRDAPIGRSTRTVRCTTASPSDCCRTGNTAPFLAISARSCTRSTR